MRKMLSVSSQVILLGLMGLVAGCITINLPPQPGPLEEEVISGSGSSKVLLVEISGLISSQRRDGFMEKPSPVSFMKEVLTKANEDPQVKAIVLRINTPGGTVTASDVLYHELKTFKSERKLPIVASIMDLGTSGGYYVASAADKIVAHPSSVTGSLGVVMLTVNVKGLLDKIGVEANSVTSGPKKDMGSPLRPMTADERAIFQGVIDSFHEQFLGVIAAGRPRLNTQQIRKVADGRIYSGHQAKDLGLVDEIGYLDDAIELAKREAGLQNAQVVLYRRPGRFRPNIYASMSGGSNPWQGAADNELLKLFQGGTPQFMYLWVP